MRHDRQFCFFATNVYAGAGVCVVQPFARPGTQQVPERFEPFAVNTPLAAIPLNE